MASTISTSGIASGSIIRAEHALRIIDALSGDAINDIYITGSLGLTGSLFVAPGSLPQTGSGFEWMLSYDTGSGEVLYSRRNSTSGTSGVDGTSGTSGSSGTSGEQGETGSSGTAGTAGTT